MQRKRNRADVLHILWSGEIGGKERAVLQLVRSQIASSEYRPALAFGRASGPYFEAARQLACPTLDLNIPNGHAFHRIPALTKLLSDFPAHHFHCAEIPVMLASAACRSSRRLFSQRGGHHQYGFTKRLRNACAAALMRRLFHGISANSRHASSRTTPILPSGVHCEIIYNGLDFDQLAPLRPPSEVLAEAGIRREHGSIIIGTSAHLRSWKRTDRLIRALAQIPSPLARLVIVGDGPDRSRLEALAAQAGQLQRVSFLGMKHHIGDYLQIMDVFALASGPEESFGNSVVEALGTGVPCIVFEDGGGLVEHVAAGTNGFVVRSVEELAHRLIELQGDPHLREQLSRAARQRARASYSLSSMVKNYDAWYRRTGMQPDTEPAPPSAR